MLKTFKIATAAALMVAATAPALANPGYYGSNQSQEFRGFEQQGSYNGYAEQQAAYGEQQAMGWQDGQGNYCQRKSGTTGMLLGGVLGGVLGHEIAGRRNRTLGTIIGAVGGGLVGRSIERGGSKCR